MRQTQTNVLRNQQYSRDGISLLEIVLAIGLMAIAGTLFTQLVGIGNRAAAYSRDMSTAQILCESIMADLQASVLPLESAAETPSATHPEWSYSIQVGTISTSLNSVLVEARRNDTTLANPPTFRLTQWIASSDPSGSSTDSSGTTSGSNGSGSTGSSSSGSSTSGSTSGSSGGTTSSGRSP